MQTKILAFSGSIRTGSYSTRLLGAAVRELSEMECEVTRISLEDYPLPLYDGNLELEKGIPDNATKLARMFHEHDGFLIAGPEYNGSLSPLLKNTLDWVSRVSSDKSGSVSPYSSKVAAICSSSPGAVGGMRMLGHLRDVLLSVGVLVVSEQISVGAAASAFDDLDKLTNERQAKFLAATCKSLVTKATHLKRR